ncbi:hypothetical protein PIB30_066199 [Stylosanthes scabra]|uniref:Uncharacterized protein n=1 Tax=Stylosanthes scabra TaxID=79078 RepID=A0ABU6UMU0_9FABA|nr:hypothetical protein [Stylosanthes scabra]
MLVFVAERPVVISVRYEMRRNVRIIARRYNTSLDLSRPVKVETIIKTILLHSSFFGRITIIITLQGFSSTTKLALSKLLSVASSLLSLLHFVGFIGTQARGSLLAVTTRGLRCLFFGYYTGSTRGHSAIRFVEELGCVPETSPLRSSQASAPEVPVEAADRQSASCDSPSYDVSGIWPPRSMSPSP